MIQCRYSKVVVTSGLLLIYINAFAYELQHNPFRPPDNLSVNQNAQAPVPSHVTRTGDELELRAIVADGSNSLVDVNGRILRIGDTIEGYLLLSVNEKAAVFKAGEDRITVFLHKDDKELNP